MICHPEWLLAARDTGSNKNRDPSTRARSQCSLALLGMTTQTPTNSRKPRPIIQKRGLVVPSGEPVFSGSGGFLLRLHGGPESLGSLLGLLRGEDFLAGGDRPTVAEGVVQLPEAISPEHVGDRHGFAATGGDCLFEGGVHIGNVEVQAGRGAAQRLRRLGRPSGE